MRDAFFSKGHFLFDLDGTLVDSTAAHARAFVDALIPGHPALAASFKYDPFAGCPTREVFQTLGVTDEAELSALVRRKQQLYRDALERGEVAAFVGAVDLLERLQENGARLFLVTGASRVSVARVLELAKLARFFEGITVAEDVSSGKPSPEPYLYTLVKYGLEKQDCLAIEDGESGIVAAQQAGLDAVLVHTDLDLPGARNVRDFKTFSVFLFP